MDLAELQDKAVNRYFMGYNCAESVLMTMAEANGFTMCGCVSGSLMFLGLKYGRDNETQNNDKLYTLVNKFCDEFELQFSVLDCKKLIGLDLRTDEGKILFDELKIRETNPECFRDKFCSHGD